VYTAGTGSVDLAKSVWDGGAVAAGDGPWRQQASPVIRISVEVVRASITGRDMVVHVQGTWEEEPGVPVRCARWSLFVSRNRGCPSTAIVVPGEQRRYSRNLPGP
jgi:hypothetical protein